MELCFAFIPWFVLPLSFPVDGLRSFSSNGPISASAWISETSFLRQIEDTGVIEENFMYLVSQNGMGVIWSKLYITEIVDLKYTQYIQYIV